MIIRIAELEIDPDQLEPYQAELREEIAISINSEPGVQAIYAVAENAHPDRLHLLEIYADQAAYQAHIVSPHFLRYKAATKDMVRSLRLMDAMPVMLGARPPASV